MANDFSEPVGKIVDNYLSRLKSYLRGIPEPDQEEVVREIYSHIYESYTQDPTEDDIERILLVLDRLGEPAEVVASRMGDELKRFGKKRKLPLYILAGVVIGLFGIPLGLGGFAVLLGLAITLAALTFVYYAAAVTLLLAGWVTFTVTLIRLFAPDFLIEYIHTLDQIVEAPWSVVLNLAASLFCALIGLGMLKLGRHLLKGTRFLFNLPKDALHRFGKQNRILPDAAAPKAAKSSWSSDAGPE